MKSFRKLIFWLHLISGVTAGIVIFIMSVTGALLSFEKNIIEYAEREMRTVSAPENARKLSAREILAKVSEVKPEAKPSAITFQNKADAAVNVALGRDGQVFVNSYTGEITGDGAKGVREFFRSVTDWHRWLALSGDGRPIGKAITGACNLAFLVLAISGIYIWFPRRLSRRHFKPVLWFRGGLKGKARDFNWHNVIGFWTSLVLIILTITATVISYQWASNLLYTLTGNEMPQQQSSANAPNNPGEQSFILPENLNEIWAKAENQTSWKSISLRLPVTKDSAVFTIDEGIYWNIFARSTLTIDTRNAEIAKWESYGEQNSARQLRSWFRFTHTGETGGIVGQFIGFLACVGGAFLVWTGFSLVLRRFRAWLAKSKKDFEPQIDAD
ncbi:MAG TPA: PepSY-associated TM helix domain-containing protein [Pyrinomonadaceae bacterium]